VHMGWSAFVFFLQENDTLKFSSQSSVIAVIVAVRSMVHERNSFITVISNPR